jgi:tRNA(Ile)-lysidine synthetase-like protein
MKINTLKTLPKTLGIAFSGGADSSVMLDVAIKLNREVAILTFDHKNTTSEYEIDFAQRTAKKYDVKLIIGEPYIVFESGDSKERFWSECRNAWFKSFDMPVATGHNLNDATEWYLMTALTGNGGHYMEYSNENIIRPLLTTSRSLIEQYVVENNIAHITDITNGDVNFAKRNKVRHELIPYVLGINPGILKTVKKNIIRKQSNNVV